MNIDKELTEILTNWSSGEFPDMKIVDEIKAAFKEAGYRQTPPEILAMAKSSPKTFQECVDRGIAAAERAATL